MLDLLNIALNERLKGTINNVHSSFSNIITAAKLVKSENKNIDQNKNSS